MSLILHMLQLLLDYRSNCKISVSSGYDNYRNAQYFAKVGCKRKTRLWRAFDT